MLLILSVDIYEVHEKNLVLKLDDHILQSQLLSTSLLKLWIFKKLNLREYLRRIYVILLYFYNLVSYKINQKIMSDFDRLCMHIFPFLKTENSVKTEYNICDVYGEGSVDNIMCSKLFRKFHESTHFYRNKFLLRISIEYAHFSRKQVYVITHKLHLIMLNI